MANVTLHAHLFSIEQGGRQHPFNEGYCPHLTAEGDQTYLAVRVIQCPEWVNPGEIRNLKFHLMYHPRLDYSGLQVGSMAKIFEGPRLIGSGRVVSVEFE